MKYSILAVFALFALSSFANNSKVPRASTAINKKYHPLKIINIDQFEKMQSKEVFDANNDEIRKEKGMIPGAKPLPKVTDFDLALLPTDKTANIVFYCANTMCTASHDAAKYAIKSGYSNVSVLGDGIQGWIDAKKATQPYHN